MQRGEPGGEPPVDLFRVGRVRIAGAQARLEVNDRDLLVEGGQRGGEDGGRVSLHDDRVRLLAR